MMNTSPLNPTISAGRSIDDYIAGHSKLVVVPNMGNAGDSLINFAMYSMLKKRSIPFNVIEARHLIEIDAETTYVVMVNGALHHGEHRMDGIVRRLSEHGAKMILHSATICDRDDLVKQLPRGTIVITREPVTFQYVGSLNPELTSVLSEDAALAIADGDIMLPDPTLILRFEYRLRCAFRTLRLGYPAAFALSPTSYRNGREKNESFYAFRNDDESIGAGIGVKGNVDLSEP